MSLRRIGSGPGILHDVERVFMPPPDRMGLSKMEHDKKVFCERYSVVHQPSLLSEQDMAEIREWEVRHGYCSVDHLPAGAGKAGCGDTGAASQRRC